VTELFPRKLVFRRYRVARMPLDAALARGLRRRTLSCLATLCQGGAALTSGRNVRRNVPFCAAQSATIH
jgi:hypothetical protein